MEITTELIVAIGLVIILISLVFMDGSQELQMMIASGLIWYLGNKPKS